MATPRKHWLRLYESMLDEDWDDATLATVVRLMCWLNRRWARNGIPHAEAGRAVITKLQLLSITRQTRPDRAHARLTAVSRVTGLRLIAGDDASGSVTIDWPKFSILQEYGSRSPGSDRAVTAPSDSETSPTPIKNPPVVPLAGDGGPAKADLLKRTGGGKRPAPEALTDEELRKLEVWAAAEEPWAVPELGDLIASCLDYHGGRGNNHASWLRTVKNWVRKERSIRAERKVNGARASPRGGRPAVDMDAWKNWTASES